MILFNCREILLWISGKMVNEQVGTYDLKGLKYLIPVSVMLLNFLPSHSM